MEGAKCTFGAKGFSWATCEVCQGCFKGQRCFLCHESGRFSFEFLRQRDVPSALERLVGDFTLKNLGSGGRCVKVDGKGPAHIFFRTQMERWGRGEGGVSMWGRFDVVFFFFFCCFLSSSGVRCAPSIPQSRASSILPLSVVIAPSHTSPPPPSPSCLLVSCPRSTSAAPPRPSSSSLLVLFLVDAMASA